MSKSMRANLMLLLTAFIWGLAFVAQDVAAGSVGPFTFNGLRMGLAALAILPVTAAMNARAARGKADGLVWKEMTPAQRRELFVGGACCGLMLALGSVLQQLGITLGTGAGKAGFITALYIVLVPLLGLFWKKRVGALTWIAVVLAALGLYFLCVTSGLALEAGDGALILSAGCYAGHILVVDHFSRRTDCVKMSAIQFATTSALCLVGAALLEHPAWQDVRACAVPLLYAGVMSGAMGYTLQILAQRDAEPTVASLLMSLESVFAVLAGWVLLGDALSARELLGCGLMMGGIVLAQLPSRAPADCGETI